MSPPYPDLKNYAQTLSEISNALNNLSSTTMTTCLARKKGMAVMKDPLLYQSVSIPIEERKELGIRGLIPAGHIPLEVEVERCMEQLRTKSNTLEKYLFLQSIQDVNEHLYYAILMKHTVETMPLVYTPTVGEACQKFSSIYRGTLRGLYISLEDAGSVDKVLDNWPQSNVSTIVVTDGERILGLGDLGVNGMGIPIGKLALYTACAGIDPANVMPVHIDVGTNNQDNLLDPYYLGLKRRREEGPDYDRLIAEFFRAVQNKFGQNTLIQFEDFGNRNAFRLLHTFQDKACTFNDDIQGTAAVALAGLFASEAITGKSVADHLFLFAGAGEAGAGIAELIAYSISIEKNLSLEDARKKVFLLDSKGLVTKSRLDSSLAHHKRNFAHESKEECPDLRSAVNYLRPSVLIGVSAMPNTFDKSICQQMAEYNERPIIFALSNPTSKAECTAQEAYEWTDGRVVFSSGSPFDAVTLQDGRRFVPGQGNNAYIFPGIGLGALAAGSTKITDHDMLIAAQTLASQVTEKELNVGCLYPPLTSIRDVSANIAAAIARNALKTGVATNKDLPLEDENNDILSYCKSLMYNPFTHQKLHHSSQQGVVVRQSSL